MGRRQPLGTDFRAVHDGAASEQAIGTVEVLQSLARGLVTAVDDEAMRLQQPRGPHELVRVPPVGRALAAAASAEDAFVRAIERITLLRRLEPLPCRRCVVILQARVDRVVLLEEVGHVDHQVPDDGKAGQRAQHDRCLRLRTRVMQASPFRPLMFIASEPQTPSRQDRRSVNRGPACDPGHPVAHLDSRLHTRCSRCFCRVAG
jgi:hypothetical protein